MITEIIIRKTLFIKVLQFGKYYRNITEIQGIENLDDFKVTLRWLGAVLQYPCKIEVVVSSFNIPIRVIHH